MTSSIVVSPRATRAAPLSRKVRIPSPIAISRSLAVFICGLICACTLVVAAAQITAAKVPIERRQTENLIETLSLDVMYASNDASAFLQDAAYSTQPHAMLWFEAV